MNISYDIKDSDYIKYDKNDAWQVSKQLHLIDGQKPQVETEKLATQYIQDKLSITDFKTAVPEQDITYEIHDALVLHAIGKQAELKKLITGWEDKLARL